MDDLTFVKVVKTLEDLGGDFGERLLGSYTFTFERSVIHILQEDLDLTCVIVHTVAPHHKRIVNGSEDLDLSTDVTTHGVLVVTVDDFKTVDPLCLTVPDHPHSSTGSATDSTKFLEI